MQRFYQPPLLLGIERARWFVEDEERRVGQQRARDGDPLPLTAGEIRAAFGQHGLIAIRQRVNEFGGARVFGRSFDFRSRCVLPAIGEIFCDGRRQHEAVLRDEREMRS